MLCAYRYCSFVIHLVNEEARVCWVDDMMVFTDHSQLHVRVVVIRSSFS